MSNPFPSDLQSGAVPFRWKDGQLDVLLTTSRNKRRWILPKGNIPEGFTPRASAVKEAFEETGVRGYLFPRPLGTYTHRSKEGTRPVVLFPMEVLRIETKWPEKGERRRKWFRLEDAVARVKPPELKAMLRALPGFLAGEEDPYTTTALLANLNR